MKGTSLILLLLLLANCAEPKPEIIRNYNGGAALGTSYNITYLAERQLDFQREIDSVFEAVNNSMSTYLPGSDISKINQGDTTIVVDHMFREVFELSKEIHSETKGYFDPTVGVLANAWGFGPGEQIKLDSTKVDSLLQYVGFHKVDLDSRNRVFKKFVEIQFDFNAIAKGYAIDRLAMLLDEKGIHEYLVEVGGEVKTKGENKLKNKPWSVGIEDPQSAEIRSFKITIRLKDRALASSGNYRKFRVDPETGKKYVHTIDPKTGFTRNSCVLGTNVVANTCATADAYATAFMAMDLDESIQLLSSQKDLEGYIIYLSDEGNPQEFMTPGFADLVIKN